MTRDEVVAAVRNLLGTDAHLSTTETEALVQLRYAHLVDLSWWSRRRRDFHLTTTAQVSSGDSDTVTVTNGSATVTSAGTPFTSAMDGASIVIAGVFQVFVVNFSSTSVITLEDGDGNALVWPGDTASGASWRIFRTILTLPSAAQDVITLAGEWSLEEVDGGRAALDEQDPYRQTTDSQPSHWCYAGESSAGLRQIEVWPVPTSSTVLRGQYVKATPTLSGATVIDLPAQILVWGVAADAAGILFAKEGAEQWRSMQGFLEGKYTAALENAERQDMARRSLPTTFGRRASRSGFNDFDVNHLMESP